MWTECGDGLQVEGRDDLAQRMPFDHLPEKAKWIPDTLACG